MAYTDDPNNPRSEDPNASSDVSRGQLDQLNQMLAAGLLTPDQVRRMLPTNTYFDTASNSVKVNDPMNPYPLIAALLGPLAASFAFPGAAASVPTAAGGSAAGSVAGGPGAALAGADAGLLPSAATAGNLGSLVPATAGSGAVGGATAGLLPASATVGNIGSLVPATTGSGAVGAATAGGALNASSPLMKALAGIGGLVGGNLAGRAASNAAVPSQLTDLLNTMNQRTQAQTPVFNAVQQGTWTGLPNYATQGLTPPKAI